MSVNRPSLGKTPPSSRNSSLYHVPLNPSSLRKSHEPPSSPEDQFTSPPNPSGSHEDACPHVGDEGILPAAEVDASTKSDPLSNWVSSRTQKSAHPNTRTPLLNIRQERHSFCGPGPCNHGTFSPHPRLRRKDESNTSGPEDYFSGGYGSPASSDGNPPNVFQDATVEGVLGGGRGSKLSTTQYLAKKHGVKNAKMMYLTYYFPFANWIKQYKWSYLRGDVVAALTMASFYIPMSLSYASNLAHIAPINGLYSFVFNPFIYALFGSCPQMVVGPEAAGSLLVGTVVKDSVERGHSGDDDDILNAQIAGVATGMAGAVIFIAGLTRLGFLDNVLSRPFLRGFISAIGFVILVDQLIPEMGLSQRGKEVGHISHSSSLDKIIFLVRNASHSHGLTCGVAFGSFGIIMVLREIKRRMQSRYPSVAYIPDRFIVVVLSAIFAWRFEWEKQGLLILGDVKSKTGAPFPVHWPFQTSHMKHVREAMGTSFVIALLGFFESSVAAKSLGGGEGKHREGLQGMSLSANRELVALGIANLVGSLFMALPAFGGYGRSKVNASTGGKTPMSSILLSLITVICVIFLLPYFYYIPKAVLSSMISVVAWSLIEECPHDIRFFYAIGGWSELTLMFLIFAATIFYSLPLGIAIGIGLSLVSVIKHSTRPRIQILGRVPGTREFENAEELPDRLEFIEGCLIVKIPEPLTFANTGDLKNRLLRLELYGTTAAHPALPRVRSPEHNKNIIFDVHGVTGLDGSGTQVLAEIVDSYVSRGVRVFFCRVPSRRSQVYILFDRSGIVEKIGGPRHFVQSVDEALQMTELEHLSEHFRDHPEDGGA